MEIPILKKGLRRDILFLLAEINDDLVAMSPRAISRKLYWSGYQPQALSNQLYRLSRIGEIERVIDKRGRPCLRLTSAGRATLRQNVPLFDLQRKKWDGYWKLVIFDVKETDRHLRDNLRYKLESLGLGQWQRSVYITPLAVLEEMNQYLEKERLEGLAYVLKAKLGNRDRDRDLATVVWKLDDLAADYRDFIHKWRREEGDELVFWAEYQDLIERDPFLPDELLPEGWPAKEASRIFRQTLRKVFKGEIPEY